MLKNCCKSLLLQTFVISHVKKYSNWYLLNSENEMLENS